MQDNLKAYILQDFTAQKKRLSILKFIFLYKFNLSFRVIVQYRFLHLLYKKGGGKLYRVLKYFYMLKTSKYGCYLLPETEIGKGLVFPHKFPVVIHYETIIGENCIIHPNVQIGTTRTKKGAPIIGNNCFLGNGCHIIGNCKIGNNCFISPGAFICKDVPDGSIVGFGLNNIISCKGESVMKLYL